MRAIQGRVPVEAVAILLTVLSTERLASAGSSWSQQPSWSSSESSGSHRSSSVRDASRDSDISPFGPGSNNLALDIGQVFLMGDLAKYADSIGSQLHYTYGVSHLFGFDSSLGYSTHSDGQFSMTTLLTGLRMNMSWYDKVVPYALVGLGFYKPSYQNATSSVSTPAGNLPSSSVSGLLFGVHLGAGVDLELSRSLFFGAGLTFHNMFGSNTTLANGSQMAMSGSYTSFFVHLGATF